MAAVVIPFVVNWSNIENGLNLISHANNEHLFSLNPVTYWEDTLIHWFHWPQSFPVLFFIWGPSRGENRAAWNLHAGCNFIKPGDQWL